MEFRDLRQQYQLHKNEIDSAVQRVLDAGIYIGGSKLVELEARLAAYVGVKHCITCANGTDALQLALMVWGIGEGDAVFVPDFTFFSSGEVVPVVGAVPVFVDIDEDSFNISPKGLDNAIRYVIEKTNLTPKAVIAVDLFGQPADYPNIKLVADQYGLLILEDGAQGYGGRIGELRACSFGDIATTSFFPAKPLGCYGDGGALFTNNDDWAELLRSYKVHGKGKDKYDNVRLGMNSRLDALQAAILLEKHRFFDEEIEKCNQIAAEYNQLLNGVVRTPAVKDGACSSWAQYTVCFNDSVERGKAIELFEERGIPTAVYYRRPMHRQKAFEENCIKELDYSVTEKISGCCLSLPMHPYLTDDDMKTVANALREL